jgi:hypothetical protein
VNGWLSRIFLAEAIDATWSCGYTSAKGEGEKKKAGGVRWPVKFGFTGLLL